MQTIATRAGAARRAFAEFSYDALVDSLYDREASRDDAGKLSVSRPLKLKYVSIASEIKKDVPRSFGEALKSADIDQRELEQVLVLFSVCMPDIGYVQGMNFIAASAMSASNNKKTAFWFLISIVCDLPREYFTSACFIERSMFSSIVRRYHPRLSKHLNSEDDLTSALSYLCVRWTIPLFVHALPQRHTLQVWDLVLGRHVEYQTSDELATTTPREFALAYSLRAPLTQKRALASHDIIRMAFSLLWVHSEALLVEHDVLSRATIIDGPAIRDRLNALESMSFCKAISDSMRRSSDHMFTKCSLFFEDSFLDDDSLALERSHAIADKIKYDAAVKIQEHVRSNLRSRREIRARDAAVVSKFKLESGVDIRDIASRSDVDFFAGESECAIS